MPDSCCAVGCSERRNNGRGVSFFRFPSETHQRQRRRKWIAALRRTNEDGTPWEPFHNARLCSEHFYTGRPVRLSTHPDHVPSIFFDRPPCEETVRMLAQAEKGLGPDQALDLRQEPSDGCPSPVHALPGCEVHHQQDLEEEEDGEANLNDEQEEALDLRRKPSNGCPSPVHASPDGDKASMML